MTQDLSSLIERVEKCTGPNFALECQIHNALYEYNAGASPPTYTASLDAVVALVEREAPKTEWLVSGGTITMAATSKSHASGATPALALLLAFLRAKSSEPKP